MKKLIYISSCLVLVVSFTSLVHAEAQPSGVGITSQQSSATYGGSNTSLGYTPLEPIPGLTTGNLISPNSLPDIINAIFKIFITIGALFAVLMLTVGGIQYMISGGPAEKLKGIQRAQAALFGMILIAAVWLILHTINPTLLNFTLNPCEGSTSGCVVSGGTLAQNGSVSDSSSSSGTPLPIPPGVPAGVPVEVDNSGAIVPVLNTTENIQAVLNAPPSAANCAAVNDLLAPSVGSVLVWFGQLISPGVNTTALQDSAKNYASNCSNNPPTN